MTDPAENHASQTDAATDQDDSDSDDIEPKLKYSRMGNGLVDILNSDSVSCVCAHTKFICVGTEWGFIHILDHEGNKTEAPVFRSSLNSERLDTHTHTVAINQISIDSNGDYVATCSDDGRVVVFGLYTSEKNQKLDLERLVRSVAIDPFYYRKGSGRRFVTGDDSLVLHEKSFFSQSKSTVLASASTEGGVKNIKWSPGGEFLAWASHVGFRVYDLVNRISLGLIKWTTSTNIETKCYICWKSSFSVVVGWFDTVRVCDIKTKTTNQSAGVSPYFVQLVYTIQTDYLVCGVGPLGDNLVILGSEKGSGVVGKEGKRPHLQVIQPEEDGYTDLGIDFLSLRGFQKYSPCDYSLECLPDEMRYVIVSPKDIVVACPCDADDRLDWLLKNQKYKAALETLKGNKVPLRRHTLLSVGMEYVDHLLENRLYVEAGHLAPQILGYDKQNWEMMLKKFAKVQQLRAIADYLPVTVESALHKYSYELVLYEYLQMDEKGFLEKIKKWPPNLYDAQLVTDATMNQIINTRPAVNPALFEALGLLYSHVGKHDKALKMYLRLENKGVFDLIKQHKLYWTLHTGTLVAQLMKLDIQKTVDLLLGSDEVKPELIVKVLSDNDNFYNLYMYLSALDAKDTKSCRPFHSILVRLYADFAKDKLLDLLKKSDHYAIQDALKICKERRFNEELVHLLGKIGSTAEALKLILCEIKDVDRAINFCIEQNDLELWEDLICHCLEQPTYVTLLLKRIASYVDPRILIQRIGNDMKIPDLKEALVKMMRDYRLQLSVQEDCSGIITSDYFEIQDRLRMTRQKGLVIRGDQNCSVCCKSVVQPTETSSDVPTRKLTVFYCSHVYHVECLPSDDSHKFSCILCAGDKKRLM